MGTASREHNVRDNMQKHRIDFLRQHIRLVLLDRLARRHCRPSIRMPHCIFFLVVRGRLFALALILASRILLVILSPSSLSPSSSASRLRPLDSQLPPPAVSWLRSSPRVSTPHQSGVVHRLFSRLACIRSMLLSLLIIHRSSSSCECFTL
ncbi:hypothetical protein BC835DRAFT_385809 [Cytidiella melzeri]|nr:hypothetical protein BC835DRAFT_385809 [Cytidiella melzeri]